MLSWRVTAPGKHYEEAGKKAQTINKEPVLMQMFLMTIIIIIIKKEKGR